MNLPSAPAAYAQADQARVRDLLRQADQQNVKKNADQTIASAKITFRENKLILTSPNGTEYYLTVTNGGVLGTTAV